MVLELLSALTPLFWGLIAWFFITGPGSFLPYSLVVLATVVALSLIWHKPLEFTRRHYQFYLFDRYIPLPPWFLFSLVSICLLLARYFYSLATSSLTNSLIMGVTISPILEELIARPLFIAFNLTARQAIIYNIISSAAFALMHAGYDTIPLTIFEYLFVRGHFLFSFTLGMIAYQTKRIELCMLIHMLSNFLRYTLPVLILGQTIHSAFALPLDIMIVIILALGNYRKK